MRHTAVFRKGKRWYDMNSSGSVECQPHQYMSELVSHKDQILCVGLKTVKHRLCAVVNVLLCALFRQKVMRHGINMT